MSRIGFIGIGNMGKPMALNLLQAGHNIKVFDLSKKAQQSLVGQGAISAASLSDTVKEVDFVITMLPTGKEVKAIFTSPDFLSNAANNTILYLNEMTAATTGHNVNGSDLGENFQVQIQGFYKTT